MGKFNLENSKPGIYITVAGLVIAVILAPMMGTGIVGITSGIVSGIGAVVAGLGVVAILKPMV